MRFSQGFGLIGQVGHFSFALSALDAKIAELAKHATALLEQLTQFSFQVAPANLVFAAAFEFIVGPPTGRLDFGFHGRQFGLGCPHRVFCDRKVAYGCGLTLVRGTRLVLKHAQVTFVRLQPPSYFSQPLSIGLKICTKRGFLFGHALDVGGQFAA